MWRSSMDIHRWTLPVLADQQELIYISSVRTVDVVGSTFRERWMIGTNGKRKSQGIPCCQRDLMMMTWWDTHTRARARAHTHTHTHTYIYNFLLSLFYRKQVQFVSAYSNHKISFNDQALKLVSTRQIE